MLLASQRMDGQSHQTVVDVIGPVQHRANDSWVRFIEKFLPMWYEKRVRRQQKIETFPTTNHRVHKKLKIKPSHLGGYPCCFIVHFRRSILPSLFRETIFGITALFLPSLLRAIISERIIYSFFSSSSFFSINFVRSFKDFFFLKF